jgi:hypothetical protein
MPIEIEFEEINQDRQGSQDSYETNMTSLTILQNRKAG